MEKVEFDMPTVSITSRSTVACCTSSYFTVEVYCYFLPTPFLYIVDKPDIYCTYITPLHTFTGTG